MTLLHTPNALVAQLADALEERGISYCHWKSNTAIDKSETADNDLDLLVDRSQAAAFREVLSLAGFSRVERQGKPLPPGKEDYIGYDTETGKLVHVDAHYQLVLGHDRTKNYRIPLERNFLDLAERAGVFYLPPTELEYVVFLVRMVLKYAIWDEVLWQALRGRRPGLKTSEQEELADLESRSDQQLVANAVQDIVPWLGDGLLEDCHAVARNEVSLVKRLQTGRKLHRRLTAHARRREGVDGALRLVRRINLAWRRRAGSLPQFQFANGGAIVAVIGGDGSGKSTAIEELSSWLGAEFETRQIHLGKPQWSATTYAVRGALKMARVARQTVARVRPAPVTNDPDSDAGYRAVAWLACTARDRFLAYRRARRFADGGGVVISDRYPHPALQSMDVPLISSITGSSRPSRLKVALQGLEESYHDRIELPEVLIVLRVDPETAAKRKTDEPSEYVKRRVAEVWDIDWSAASIPVVDARRAKEEVAAELKSVIWEALA